MEFSDTLKKVGYLLSGFLLVGAILDTIGNGLSLITTESSITNILILSLLWILFEILCYLGLIKWGKYKVKKIGISPRLFFIGVIIAFLFPLVLVQLINEQTKIEQQAFLHSDSLNVLVIKFEDYITNENSECVGKSITESIELLAVRKNLNINVKYLDEIVSPQNYNVAKRICSVYNADVLIYGLAKRLDDYCDELEVSFRYILNQDIVDRVGKNVNVRVSKHDLDYSFTTSLMVQKGLFSVNLLPLNVFIESLIDIKRGEWNATLLKLDSIVSDPLSLPSIKANRLIVIGQLFMELKEYERAVSAFHESERIKPNYSCVNNYIGKAYLNIGDVEKAINSYNTALRKNPNNSASYSSRATAYLFSGKFEKALEDINKAISISNDRSSYFLIRADANIFLRNAKAARNDINLISNKKDYDEAHYNITSGNLNMLVKNFPVAVRFYKRAISVDGNSFVAKLNLGMAYKESEEYNEGIQVFDEIIKSEGIIDNKRILAKAYWYRGLCYKALDFIDHYFDDIDCGIEIGDYANDLIYDKALTLIKVNKYKQAIPVLMNLPRNEEKFNNVNCTLGHIFGHLKMYKTSIAFYDSCNQSIVDASVQNNIGMDYTLMGKKEKAKLHFFKSLQIDSTNINGYFQLAQIYLLQDSLNLSTKYLEKSGSNFDSKDGKYMRAKILADKNILDESISLLKIILSSDSMYYKAHYLLHDNYVKLSKEKLAQHHNYLAHKYDPTLLKSVNKDGSVLILELSLEKKE